ncbi:MAG: DUF481 domain-containing protein [Lentisphaerae bacterium]|nr:DUF481 domain-containing protein [Lentisphaerota bacterium]
MAAGAAPPEATPEELAQEYLGLKRRLFPEDEALAKNLRDANLKLQAELDHVPPLWKAELSLGANLDRGNSDVTLLSAGLMAERKQDAHLFLLLADGSYGETDGVRNVGKAESEIKYTWDFAKYAFLVVQGDAERDEEANLDYRTILSPGLGLNLCHPVRHTELRFSLGPAFVQEKYRGESLNENVSALVQQEFNWKFNSAVEFFQRLKFLSDLADVETYIATLNCGMDVEFYRSFFLRLAFKDQYVNRPADDKKRNDMSLRSSLVWKL